MMNQPNRFRSVAIWPFDGPEPISLGNTANRSDDWHTLQDEASAVCQRLRRQGFGGNRRVFPLTTWVEEVDPAGKVVAVTYRSPVRTDCGADYASRVAAYEAQGLTTSDAQGTVDAEEMDRVREQIDAGDFTKQPATRQ